MEILKMLKYDYFPSYQYFLFGSLKKINSFQLNILWITIINL